MSFPGNNRDKLVRATDLDALSCRLSANKKGYFEPPDEFIPDLLRSYEQALQFCDGYTQMSAGRSIRGTFSEPKLPLINRGTYFRTECINRVVNEFIREHGKCQIVALGGGSDTRSFRVLQEHANVCYTEIDFPESTKIKKIAISNSQRLQTIIREKLPPIMISSRAEMAQLDADLHTENFNLVSFDLRKAETHGRAKFAFLDKKLPTLVISECVLCYMTPEENIAVLKFWKSLFESMAVIFYDPMSLNDAFGETMALNLTKRGLNLQTFTQFPDLHARKQLFEETLGFEAMLTDLASVGGYTNEKDSWISKEELARVSRLEMIDEVEEIRLLLGHYCLIYAESGMKSQFAASLNWRM
ncbi:hypothetical protein OXX69_004697 [Metschnikowia pulcherrima]